MVVNVPRGSPKVIKTNANTKKSLMQDTYDKAYKNLQARVRAQQKQGYYGFKMPRKVKNPKQESIDKLNRMNWRYIREHSPETKSTITGQSVTPIELRREQATKRSESAKKGAITRKENREKAYESFEREFPTDKGYRPSEQNIRTKNFMETVIKPIVPSDYFGDLMNRLIKAPYHRQYYRGETPEVPVMHSENRSLLINAINSIIKSDMIDVIYYRIKNGSKLKYLIDKIEASVFSYKEQEVKTSVNEAVSLIANGALSLDDYNKLLNEESEDDLT